MSAFIQQPAHKSFSMKVNKANPLHWLYLALFGTNVLISLMFRLTRRPTPRRRVILYGHKLTGNLKAIYDGIVRSHSETADVCFLTMDPTYHRDLLRQGYRSVLAIAPHCIKALTSTDAIISDHGLHALRLLLGRSSLHFFDVWHGIPFKGFDADDFRIQHHFDETWVASPLLKKLYEESFGFNSERLATTGYARTDRLVRLDGNSQFLRVQFGLTETSSRKLVLFAPTWKQDASHRALFPFGVAAADFLGQLSGVCEQHDAALVVRMHLNSPPSNSPEMDNVYYVPSTAYPDTEGLLLISDVLVCDWSSLAFDYLLLNRPTLFLDVEAPFSKGFSLGPEYRFGPVIPDMPALVSSLNQYLADPGLYQERFAAKHEEIRARVYGAFADGNSTRRCLDRLHFQLKQGESSL